LNSRTSISHNVYGFMPPDGAGACSVAIPMMFSPQIWIT
jgi:hypothetical protein